MRDVSLWRGRNEIRFSPDPVRAGYPWCRASSQPQKDRFAPNSALEEARCELFVPLGISAPPN